ncbi:MAG: response regulator, partial [Deltaproteobacteria bacterium]
MPDGASPRRRVLVVDDDLDTRATTADALGDRYHVVTAATVAEALACVAADPPAAIVLDLKLAGESGWDLMRALQEDAALRTVPIVILSATPATEPPAGVGAWAAYLTKPCPMGR